jgi:hypothetical protein
MKDVLRYVIRSSVIGTLVLFALLFVPAGTLNYWQGWAYMAVAIVASGTYTLYLARHDPALLKRRTEAGISHEKETCPEDNHLLSLCRIYGDRHCATA